MIPAAKVRPRLAAMSEQEVLTSIANGIGTITLNRPDALNAITPTMLGQLNDALDEMAQAGVSVVVLTGAGRAFSAGVDLKALGDRELTGGSVGDILDLPARSATAKLADGGFVTIAKVNGFCFTGALELALACDLMVCADGAKMADTHAKFGLRPTWGLSARLPAAIGAAKARELSYTARTFTGAEAAEMGMACRSAAADELDAVVDEMAGQVVANSAGSLRAYKDLYRSDAEASVGAGLGYEAATAYEIADTDERLAGFRS
jgi:enoyl-CoA hydratase/carnithine racemase